MGIKGPKVSGGIWASRLKSSCKALIGHGGEGTIYSTFETAGNSHVEDQQVNAHNTATGAEAFVKKLCLTKRSTKKNSKTIWNSCKPDMFFFEESSWEDVLDLRQEQQRRVEL